MPDLLSVSTTETNRCAWMFLRGYAPTNCHDRRTDGSRLQGLRISRLDRQRFLPWGGRLGEGQSARLVPWSAGGRHGHVDHRNGLPLPRAPSAEAGDPRNASRSERALAPAIGAVAAIARF